MSKKLWEGRLSSPLDSDMERFSSSFRFDRRLYNYDIIGSIAHVKMLEKVGIITEDEKEIIVDGLTAIEVEIEKCGFKDDIPAEDIHSYVEIKLIERIGVIGEKLHIGRSRNDQIVLDMRLYLRDQIKEIEHYLNGLLEGIINLSEIHIEVLMPGFTHLQHAEPVTFGHYLMSYFWMLQRDRMRLNECLKRVNVLPLGAAALAGTSLPIDRQYVAQLLKFDSISANSIDTVGDRDFIIEFISNCAILIMHLSRLSEELIMGSSREFGFVELPDEFCTGSSIMPQKKNPDFCELVRGKTGRIYGHLISTLTFMKGLPLAYNRDMQEDKEPLFDTVETIKEILIIYARLLPLLKINVDKMTQQLDPLSLTTHLANYLTQRYGWPFRKAHKRVAELARYCMDNQKVPQELTDREIQLFIEDFTQTLLKECLLTREVVWAKTSEGGTSPHRIREQIEEAKKLISA